MHKLNTRFVLLVVAATLVAAAGTAVAHQLQTGRLGHALLWQADKAEKEDRLDHAVKHLGRYLEFRADDNEQRARLGKLLACERLAVTHKSRERALFVLEQVLSREPARNELRPLVVRLALELKRWKVAEEHLQVLRKAAPEDGKVAFLMAQWHEGQKQITEAETWFGKSAKYSPSHVESYLRQAELMQKRLRKGKATTRLRQVDDVFEALLKHNPKSVPAYLARYNYLNKCGSLPEAAQDLAKAAELAPDDVDVLLTSAAQAQGLKDFDKARAELRRGLKLHPQEVRLYEAIAWLEIQAGQRDTGLDYVRQVLKTAKGETRKELLWSLANLLLDGGDVPEAETVIGQLRQAHVNPPILTYLQARVQIRKSQWSEAARSLERTRPQLESSPQLLKQLDLFLGQCYEQLREPAQQLASYNRVLAVDPDSIVARLGSAAAQTQLGRTGDALAEYKQLAAQPNAPSAARLELARLLILQNLQSGDKDWQKVEKALREAEEAQPDAIEVVLLRVEALAAQNQFDAAVALLKQARQREPKRVEHRTMLATILLRQGKADEAGNLLDEAERDLGDGMVLRLARARLLSGLPLDQAKPGMAKLAANVENFSPEERSRLLGGLAEVWSRLGDSAQAEALWLTLAKEPRHASDLNLRLLLFDLALAKGDDDAMRRLQKEMQKLEGQQGPLTRYALATRLIWLAGKGGQADLDEVRVHLDQVATQKPSWAVVHLAKAEMEILKGNDEQAIAEFRRAIDLGERGPRTVRKLVELLYRKQRFAEADQEIRRLQTHTLIAADMQRLAADLSLRNQDVQRAVELATQAVSADSKDYRDQLWLGQVLAASGKQPQQAEIKLRKAVELGPQAPETWVALIRFLVFVEQPEAAETVLAEAQAKLPASKRHLALGQCQEALGNPEQARKSYQAALAEKPGDVDVLRSVALFYLRYGRFAEAEPILRQLVDRKNKLNDIDAAWARHNLALALAAAGDYPQFLQALAMVDLAIDKSGKVVETAAAEHGPAELRARAHVLAQQPQRPQRKKAIGLLESLQRSQALTPEDQFLLARLHNAEGNWPKARGLLRDLVTNVSRIPLYLMAYGSGLVENREFGEAEKVVAKLELLETNNKVEKGTYATVQLRALMLEALGEGENAVALIRDHVRRPGAPADEFLVLVRYLEKQKKTDAALDVCEAALKTCPAEQVTAAAVVVLRSCKASEEQCLRVERWLQAALEKDGNSVVLRLHFADVQEARGRYQDVEATYRAILRDHPTNVAALNNQAWLLAQLNDRGAEALPLIVRAIELMGPRPELLDTRALVQMKLGRPDQAIGDLERVTAEAPSATRWFHLACAYKQAHNPEAARRAFRHAREMGLQQTHLHPLERGVFGPLFEELSKQ